MTRPTALYIDAQALVNNIACVKRYAPRQRIIAMVKSNAYGCDVALVAPILEPLIDSFGVACIEEARQLRRYCPHTDCILVQGIFSPDELAIVSELHLTLVIHTEQQLHWLIDNPLPKAINVWIKVDTGMHRLGFSKQELPEVIQRVKACAWVAKPFGVMTHLACADQPQHPLVAQQLAQWQTITAELDSTILQSVANSASIVGLPQTHATVVRPGIMLYGVSPFEDKLGGDFGLKPVMRFESALTTIHHYAAGETIGYGATWRCNRPSIIGVVPVGYGDGYPRHISSNTPTWVNGCEAPIVGRVSMDMMTIDITDCPHTGLGDRVELWGTHIPIELVAKHANTIAYELMCQVSQRVIRQYKEGF